MVKFLIALAEMFSAFSIRLHDLSENVPASMDDDAVREIVREELDTESIDTDDITGLDRYVTEAIEEYDFSDKISERAFYNSVRDLVWTYANSRGIDTNVIYVCSEEWSMQRYLEERAKEWRKEVEQREAVTKARIIREYEEQRQTAEVAPTESTITLGDSTTTIKI